MTTIAELRQAITDNTVRIEEVRVIVDDLRNGTTIPPAVQAEIDGAAADVADQATTLNTIIGGTPPPVAQLARRLPPTPAKR